MSRINQKFNELRRIEKKALIGFITAGDPNFSQSQEIFNSLPSSGIDIIELGIPFSDPMADGPTIQKASQRSIKTGFSIEKTIKMILNFRSFDKKTPIVLMGYFNLFFQYGLKKFFSNVRNLIDGIIIVDLPPEENHLIERFLIDSKVDLIRLVTPTTDSIRLKKILKGASGFLYYVSIMGITGTKKPKLKVVESAIDSIKKKTKLPVVVGFGINNKNQVREISKFADGTVVGSSIVKIIEEYSNNKVEKIGLVKDINQFIKKIVTSCYVK